MQLPPGLTTISQTNSTTPDAGNAKKPVILRQLVLAQLDTRRTKVSGTLAQQQASSRHDFDKKVWSLPAFTVGQMVSINRPPLTTPLADRQTSAKYKYLVLRTTGLFKRLEVRDHAPKIDENRLSSTNSVNRASPVGLQYCQRLLESRNYRCHTKKCRKNIRMNFSCTKLLVTVKLQTEYSTKSADMANKPRMTP